MPEEQTTFIDVIRSLISPITKFNLHFKISKLELILSNPQNPQNPQDSDKLNKLRPTPTSV